MSEFDVIILGGGIAGLSTAHELKRRGYQGRILVLERNNEIGGQARSGVIAKQYWTEYCWRIYGPSYNTLRRIQREIPSDDKSSVHDQLVDIKNNILALNSGSNTVLNYDTSAFRSYLKEFNDVSWKDKLNLINKALTLFLMCRNRM
jgi:uncharacterized protein with NAD-binding domain and iron-sulfur cluster